MPDANGVIILKGDETLEQHRKTFIDRVSQQHNASLQFEVSNVQTSVTCFGADMSQLEFKIHIKDCESKEDLPDEDILTKDITRVGRTVISALKKKGYETDIDTKHYRYTEKSHIMHRADAIVKAPAGKSIEDVYTDLVEAHHFAKQFMERLSIVINEADQKLETEILR